MRGNWESAEALVLAPSQQQLQQQQQTIAEEQRLPLHSPTTPAWGGITDRIVKEEPPEDKNDDSGVSPGHYTSNSVSPRSRRSSSTVNCSLSPGSATSQDSNAMQSGNFDYSPQSIYKNFDSPLEYGRLGNMDEVVQQRTNVHQSMDVVSSSMKPVSEESEINQDILQCPVCPFTTSNRLNFTEHLGAHYAANCTTPDFTKSLMSAADINNQQQDCQQMEHGMSAMDDESRASPYQDDRSDPESEEADEPGLRVPRVNSQGKVKTFRCKQCNFVAVTKLDFWEHSRGHIKAEKLLTCPKCPFVTEYKHHLEYHLRNHFGSKPFKCDKCSYSCVNKSMLNSHLKSHSNVYQYRCANCSYATKYCHSLKLHLRKYKHNPAMVLNADGSPNPLPIIDVYGTRRGPKQKNSSSSNNGSVNKLTDENNGQTTMVNGLSSQTSVNVSIQPQSSPLSRNNLSLNPMNAIHALNNSVNQGVMGFPYGQLFAGFQMNNHYRITDETTEKHLENLKTNLFAEYAKVMANDRMIEYGQENFNNSYALTNSVNNNEPIIREMSVSPSISESSDTSKNATTTTATTTTTPTPSGTNVTTEMNKFTPLDLSKPDLGTSDMIITKFDTTRIDEIVNYEGLLKDNEKNDKPDVPSNNNNHSNANNNMRNEKLAVSSVTLLSNGNSPKTAGTSRRKGKAVKLDRRIVENDETEEEPHKTTINKITSDDSSITENTNDSGNTTSVVTTKEITTTTTTTTDKSNSGGVVGMSNEFTCQYCEIAFGNVVMYTVHMGYHGYKDPYTCNMCGHESEDKLSFFLHIARSKHS